MTANEHFLLTCQREGVAAMHDESSKAIESMRTIALENIKAYSEWSAHDVNQLAHYARQLSKLPEYETMAEFAVSLAYAAAERSLKGIREAHDQLIALRAEQPVVLIDRRTRDHFIVETDDRDDEQLRYETETGGQR